MVTSYTSDRVDITITKYYVIHIIVAAAPSDDCCCEKFVYTSISTNIMRCPMMLGHLRCHLAVGMFQFHYDPMRPPSDMRPVVNGNVIWHVTGEGGAEQGCKLRAAWGLRSPPFINQCRSCPVNKLSGLGGDEFIGLELGVDWTGTAVWLPLPQWVPRCLGTTARGCSNPGEGQRGLPRLTYVSACEQVI